MPQKLNPKQQDVVVKNQNRAKLIAMLLAGGLIVLVWVAFLIRLVLHVSGVV